MFDPVSWGDPSFEMSTPRPEESTAFGVFCDLSLFRPQKWPDIWNPNRTFTETSWITFSQKGSLNKSSFRIVAYTAYLPQKKAAWQSLLQSNQHVPNGWHSMIKWLYQNAGSIHSQTRRIVTARWRFGGDFVAWNWLDCIHLPGSHISSFQLYQRLAAGMHGVFDQHASRSLIHVTL